MASVKFPDDAYGLLLLPPADLHVSYLATILDRALWWDDRNHCPVWPDDEPMAYTFEPGGGVTGEPLCDVWRVPVYVRVPKIMACGHGVRAGGFYVTVLAGERDLCLACAEGLGWTDDEGDQRHTAGTERLSSVVR